MNSEIDSDRRAAAAPWVLVLRRAVIGIVLLLAFTVGYAWLLHASIEPEPKTPRDFDVTGQNLE